MGSKHNDMKPFWHWTLQPNAEEIKERMAKSLKGRKPNSGSFKEGRTSNRKGVKLTETQIANWKEARSKGAGWTAWNKGKQTGVGGPKGVVRSEEWKENLSKSLKGRIPWNKGMGVDRGLRFLINSSGVYNEWRMSVFKRDGFVCIQCPSKKDLQVDHIKSFARIIIENNVKTLDEAFACKELWELSNGRVLCKPCHKKTDTHGGKTRAKNFQL